MQMVRLGDYSEVRYNIKSHHDDFEIYNVANDPQETNNLAAIPGMDSLQRLMKEKVLRVRKPNASAPRPYDSELIPAIGKENTETEIQWSVYNGNFLWVPDVETLMPTATGQTKEIDLNVLGEENNVVCFEVLLNVPAVGEFTFYISANGGVVLKIHEITVIDADYGYEQGSERKASLKLEEGVHPLRLYFMETNEKENNWLNLEWSGPGMERNQIQFDTAIQ